MTNRTGESMTIFQGAEILVHWWLCYGPGKQIHPNTRDIHIELHESLKWMNSCD